VQTRVTLTLASFLAIFAAPPNYNLGKAHEFVHNMHRTSLAEAMGKSPFAGAKKEPLHEVKALYHTWKGLSSTFLKKLY
jgi:hypothetical protein